MSKENKILKNVINIILLLMALIIPLAINIKHFKPFINIKNSIFLVTVSIMSILLILSFLFSGKLKLYMTKLNLFVLLYFVWNVISYFIFPYTEKLYFNMLVCAILLFFIIQYTFNDKWREYLFYIFGLIGVIMGIYGIMQFFGIDFSFFINYFGSRFEVGSRIFTTLGNPNLQGGFSVFLLPVLLALFIKKLKGKNLLLKIFSGLAFIFNLLLLLMSQTRGSWIAAIFTIIVFIIFYFWKREYKFIKNHWRGFVVGIVVFIGLIIFGLTLLPDSFVNPQTANIRLFYYTNTIDMITESTTTLLFGRGIGSFSAYYPSFRDKITAFKLGETSLEFRVEHPHNEHLEILSDLGVVGYLLFVLIIIFALFELLKNNDILSIGIATAIVGVLLDGLMMQNLRFIVVMFLLWIAIGLSSYRFKFENNNKKLNYKEFNINGIFIVVAIFLIIILGNVALYGINHFKQGDIVRYGLGYYTQGQSQEAVYYLSNSYNLDSTDKRTLYYLAPSYMGIGDDKRAIETYKELLSLDPNFIQANNNLAFIYYSNDDYVNSKKYLLKQINSNNMFWKTYYLLSLIYMREGNIGEAFEYSSRLLNLSNVISVGDDYRLSALKMQAQYYSEKKDMNKLSKVYSAMVEIMPDGKEKDQFLIALGRK